MPIFPIAWIAVVNGMRQTTNKKPVRFVFLALLGFLCVLPAVFHAAQPTGDLPQPSGSYTVAPETLVSGLPVLFRLPSSRKLTVFRPDGSARESGAVHTGDLAVIRTSSGKLVDCIALVVQGEDTASSCEPSSEPAPSEAAPAPPEQASSTPASSYWESSSPASSAAASSGTAAVGGTAVFESSVPAASLAGIFGGEADGVSAFAPDGTERTDGPVCTGDTIVLRGADGHVLRTVAVTVLGDLTRCGTVTQDGCGLLHACLTGKSALPPDLFAAADLNRDGAVDTADLLAMKLRLRQSASPGGASPEAQSTPDDPPQAASGCNEGEH